jgi:hypothetical protein
LESGLLLPKGKVLHENLNTSFTNFDDLIDELKENRFSGYLSLSCWQFDGVLLFDTGKVSQAFAMQDGEYVYGAKCKQTIFEKSREKDGHISVHTINSETILVIISIISREDVMTDHVRARKTLYELFRQMQQDEVSGVAVMTFGKENGHASIFFHDGVPVDCTIESAGGKSLSGVQIYDNILNLTDKVNTKFKIYRGDVVAALENSANFDN